MEVTKLRNGLKLFEENHTSQEQEVEEISSFASIPEQNLLQYENLDKDNLSLGLHWKIGGLHPKDWVESTIDFDRSTQVE